MRDDSSRFRRSAAMEIPSSDTPRNPRRYGPCPPLSSASPASPSHWAQPVEHRQLADALGDAMRGSPKTHSKIAFVRMKGVQRVSHHVCVCVCVCACVFVCAWTGLPCNVSTPTVLCYWRIFRQCTGRTRSIPGRSPCWGFDARSVRGRCESSMRGRCESSMRGRDVPVCALTHRSSRTAVKALFHVAVLAPVTIKAAAVLCRGYAVRFVL